MLPLGIVALKGKVTTPRECLEDSELEDWLTERKVTHLGKDLYDFFDFVKRYKEITVSLGAG